MAEEFDYVVIGSGTGGLAVGSLLAKAGHSVCLLEAHEYLGGCAHSFPMGPYSFCAAVHYIFFCGEGEPVYNFLKKLDLHEKITFARLDPEGYDHFSCPAEKLRFRIPNGLDKWAERLIDRYPNHRAKIDSFFSVINRIVRDLRRLPYDWDWKKQIGAVAKYPAILKYRRWTLQKLFDRTEMPSELQAILAAQIGDLGEPPRNVSLVIFVALIWSYGLGAYYPTNHFSGMIESVAEVIGDAPRSAIHYNAEVSEMRLRAGRISEVVTRDGRAFKGRNFIANIDPRKCVELIGEEHFPRSFLRKVNYDYSVASYTIYLAVRDLDLRDYGFGNWNVWHYPDLDLNGTYQRQIAGDLSDPWFFMSTPTLCAPVDAPPVCPEGHQILEVVTVAGFDFFDKLRRNGRREYVREKNRITTNILDIVERDYIFDLRKHLAFKMAGTPTTNVRYLWAPQGNIYGSVLSPANVDFNRLRLHTPIPNLYLTGASAEFPSVGATILGGSRLYTHLTGDLVNPGRDLYGLW